ncbi:MAG: DNA-directed RNA polymerase subunit beta, partial [Lachnospiraceae bacterium]|nr:DNA-directed RNA polymerase subunit beta [Lachnospiraceae bacterium]
MSKNRIRPEHSAKAMRMSYARRGEVLEMPNLIEVQTNSYKWFLEEGLQEAFDDISPIEDFAGALSLEFVGYKLKREEAKYTIEECKERDTTYSAPLFVTVRLHSNEDKNIQEYEIFMGDLPLMTDTGTFVINGAERVIVSQLVRSPGMYYGLSNDKVGKELFSCQVIPNRGAWLEYETDANDIFYVRVDRTRKVPVTVLLRALGLGTNTEIFEKFGQEIKIEETLKKDASITSENPEGSIEGGFLELYKKIRPGEPFTSDNARTEVERMFFDARRYDLARVGRYKFNKKMALRNRIRGLVLAEDVIDPLTGEVIATAGTTATAELADLIQDSAVEYVTIQTAEKNERVLSNMMVDLAHFVECDPKEDFGIRERVYYPKLKEILDAYGEDPEELTRSIKENVHELVPKHITRDDIFASINYNMHLEYGIGSNDDIDHLGNRRIRAVGELLQNQYRIGLSRLERVVRERMSTHDAEDVTPQSLINIKPVTAAVKEFFGSSQLSQFM